ncbi:hypothetical protein ACLOJK_003105 [Asimina triloba]
MVLNGGTHLLQPSGCAEASPLIAGADGGGSGLLSSVVDGSPRLPGRAADEEEMDRSTPPWMGKMGAASPLSSSAVGSAHHAIRCRRRIWGGRRPCCCSDRRRSPLATASPEKMQISPLTARLLAVTVRVAGFADLGKMEHRNWCSDGPL